MNDRRLLLLVPIGFGLWLYWPILRLPNLFDTLLHIQIAHGLGWWQAWLPTPHFGYFRPLVFVPLATVREVWGGYPPLVLQTLNWLQHALNIGLVGGLAWRLWRNPRLAITVAMLFAAFPFSYQALAIYGNNVHLTIVNFILLGLHSTLRYWAHKSGGQPHGRAFLPVLACMGGALLTHESGITFVPLVGLLFLVWRGARPLSLRFVVGDGRMWLLVLLTALYLAAYSQLPLGQGPQAGADGAQWGQKLLLFQQVLAYPITIWAGQLPTWSATAVIGAGMAVLLGMAGWTAVYYPAHRCPLAFGLGWWLGIAIVMAVPLPTYYVATSARLHYFGSVGLVVAWVWLLEGVWGGAAWRKAVWGAAVVALLLPSGLFVRHMLALYERAGTPYAQLAPLAAPWPAEDGVVLVNWPAWAALPRNVFPLGADFAPVMGTHILPQAIVEGNLGRDRAPVTVLAEPSLLAAVPYPYAIYDLMAEPVIRPRLATRQQVLLVRYGAERPTAVHTGWLDYAAEATPPLATLGPLALLAGEVAGCGTAEWRTHLALQPLTAELPATLSLFVQLLGGDGQLLGQVDGPPLGLPPYRYQITPELVLHDVRVGAGGLGGHTVLVGVYDYVTGERWTAVDGAGEPLADDAWRMVCP